MSTPQPDTLRTQPDGGCLQYGYGWFLTEMQGHRLAYHPGDNSGFRAFNASLPLDETAVMVLTTDESSTPMPRDCISYGS